MIGGVVQIDDGLGRTDYASYGNRVCVQNDELGLTVCHNDVELGTITVTDVCEVSPGDHIGG